MGEGQNLDLPRAWEGTRQATTELHVPAPRRTWLERTLGFAHHEAPSDRHRRGTRGQRLAGDQIDRLVNASAGWHAIHGLPGSALEGIDHLVIGPCGVVVVHVEDRPRGRVWVGGDTMLMDGEAVPCLADSRHAAARIARLLSAAVGYDVSVSAFVVTVGAELRVREQPVDVTVCTRLEIADRLRTRVPVLGPGHVEELYAVARRADTWRDVEASVA
jgi:hypothetical protein